MAMRHRSIDIEIIDYIINQISTFKTREEEMKVGIRLTYRQLCGWFFSHHQFGSIADSHFTG